MRKFVRSLCEGNTPALIAGSVSKANHVCKMLSKATELKSESNNDYFRAVSPILQQFPMKIYG